jgi:chemotaxis regulatin CheY-phosphate phosphatase CheZ
MASSEMLEALATVAKSIAVMWKEYVENDIPEGTATELCKHYIDSLMASAKDQSNLNEGILKMLKGSAPDEQS